jgi:hypothetical protein
MFISNSKRFGTFMMVPVWVLVHPMPLSVPETLWVLASYIAKMFLKKKKRSGKTMCFLRFSTAKIQQKN